MAKKNTEEKAAKYIVKTTIQTLDEAGKKLVIPSGPKARDVPAGIVEELLQSGHIEVPGDDVEVEVDGEQPEAPPGE
ncbi:hypothetical protein QYE80_27265 [Pseudomonas tohonis]|nr:hypothetical protein L682_11020 [Pseudomonas alcaligenes OT 69]MDN4148704.1 hypothetical protein [Pseudomonas tohonis]